MKRDFSLLFKAWKQVGGMVALASAAYACWAVFVFGKNASNTTFLQLIPVYQFGLWVVIISGLAIRFGNMTRNRAWLFVGLPFLLTPALLLLIMILFFIAAAVGEENAVGIGLYVLVLVLSIAGPGLIDWAFRKVVIRDQKRSQ